DTATGAPFFTHGADLTSVPAGAPYFTNGAVVTSVALTPQLNGEGERPATKIEARPPAASSAEREATEATSAKTAAPTGEELRGPSGSQQGELGEGEAFELEKE